LPRRRIIDDKHAPLKTRNLGWAIVETVVAYDRSDCISETVLLALFCNGQSSVHFDVGITIELSSFEGFLVCVSKCRGMG
jgi:hypothetical protein